MEQRIRKMSLAVDPMKTGDISRRKLSYFSQRPAEMSVPRRLLKLGIFMIAVSYLYTIYTKNKTKDAYTVEQIVLDSWNRIIELPSVEFQKVLVGINSNVDLIVPGRRLMRALNASIKPEAKDHDSIKSMTDFEEVFSHFMLRGSTGERYFADGELFEKAVVEAEHEKAALFAVGGNAAIMAQQIARSYTKAKVFLVGPIGPRLRALLHPAVLTQNSTKIMKDEVHLIMEYKQGEILGEHIAAASNAFITSHDTLSRSTVAIDMFFKTSTSFKPDLIILSGLHLLSILPEDIWMEKLTLMKRSINQVHHSVPIHLQIGNMAFNKQYAKSLLFRVLPYVDSIGINEQELTLLAAAGDGPHADSYPPVAGSVHTHKVSDMLAWLLNTFGQDKMDPQSKRAKYRLQRIHFYCLTYHMMATRGPDWSNSPAALAAGARHAGTSACGQGTTSKSVSSDTVELRIGDAFALDTSAANKHYTFSPHTPMSSWLRDTNLMLMYSPVLVCKQPARTVGLGDQIAAVGLLHSQFYRFDRT